MIELDEPEDPSDLWHYSPPIDVPSHRLLMQGDIIVIGGGPVCIASHPCSMRKGTQLHQTQTVAPVQDHPVNAWRGEYDWMPLPALSIARFTDAAANLRELTRTTTKDLEAGHRIAVMSEIGIQLLQQRLAHHLTRSVIELETLAEQSAPILIEVTLHEEWISALGDESEPDFHQLLDAHERKLRNWMEEPRTRYQAQSTVRQEIRQRGAS